MPAGKSEINHLEHLIDIVVFGTDLMYNEGSYPSDFSYEDRDWEDEIEIDPLMKFKLSRARKIQQEIKNLQEERNA